MSGANWKSPDRMSGGVAPSWRTLIEHKDEVRKRFPKVWDLPLTTRHGAPIKSFLRNGMRVLDYGAGSERFGRKFLEGFADVHYRTLDIDPARTPDYQNRDEVDETFDLILLIEVLEHMDLSEARGTIDWVHDVLSPGGLLLSSVPNVYNPALFMSDPTHRTFISYEHLGGLLLASGLELVDLYRGYHAAPLKRFSRRLATPLFRFFNLDYAKTILAVGRKPESALPVSRPNP